MGIIRDIIFTGLLRGWPGTRCPDCKVRHGKTHKPNCPIGKWDGGKWA